MSKANLKAKIDNLLENVPDGDVIEIYYVNPNTQERTLLYQSPAAKHLVIEVDSPATAETFNKLRTHKT